MIRGRLVAINGQWRAPEDMTEERAKRLVEREFNLSHDTRLPGAQRWSAAAGRPTSRTL
jgi:putative ABC transport system permease protein